MNNLRVALVAACAAIVGGAFSAPAAMVFRAGAETACARAVYSEVLPQLQQVAVQKGCVPLSALRTPQVTRGPGWRRRSWQMSLER